MSFQFLEIIQAVQNLIKILFYFNSFHSEARADMTEMIFWWLHWQIYFKQIENIAMVNKFWIPFSQKLRKIILIVLAPNQGKLLAILGFVTGTYIEVLQIFISYM